MSSILDMIGGMAANSNQSNPEREHLLAELAQITTMERGTLTEEYRERPTPDGKGTLRKGPYYKHQCWENGRNRSRRVPGEEVPLLRSDLEAGERFDRLVEALASLAIAEGRQNRASQALQTQAPGAKKNSPTKSSRKGTAKPKRSSRKSPRVSPRKGPKN